MLFIEHQSTRIPGIDFPTTTNETEPAEAVKLDRKNNFSASFVPFDTSTETSTRKICRYNYNFHREGYMRSKFRRLCLASGCFILESIDTNKNESKISTFLSSYR